MQRVAVYCGSATPDDPVYIECARHVGRTLAELGIGIVYGGGRIGLMGALADSALAAGGEVIGVIPTAMVRPEIAHHDCTRLEVVANMHERKARFTELADGFVTLPGGVGTMDELWEAVSWAQLGYHAKPVGLLNVAGYYDGLLAFARHMAATGFVRGDHADILIAASDIEELIARMDAYVPHRAIFHMKAGDL
ncbi:MAG: TIGR00730 family Rossman fold protein [Sphingobium sp.]